MPSWDPDGSALRLVQREEVASPASPPQATSSPLHGLFVYVYLGQALQEMQEARKHVKAAEQFLKAAIRIEESPHD